MGSGADAALESADVILLRPSLGAVVDAVRLGRAVRAVIWQNIAFALGLKVLVLLTTFLGLTGLWVAVLADTGATVLVTANALRLMQPPRRALAAVRPLQLTSAT